MTKLNIQSTVTSETDSVLDLITFVSAILGTYDLSYEEFKCVDLNRDYKTDILDVIQLVNQILIS